MVDILKIKKLSELEEKLKEHVTEENWRELLFITLNYTSLNKVYIDEYNFRKLQDNSGTYAEMFEISKEKDRIENLIKMDEYIETFLKDDSEIPKEKSYTTLNKLNNELIKIIK